MEKLAKKGVIGGQKRVAKSEMTRVVDRGKTGGMKEYTTRKDS